MLIKIIPMLILMGVFSEDIEKNIGVVVNMVKATLTQHELGSHRTLMIEQYTSYFKFPADYPGYLREHMISSRDPAIDYWEQEYRLDHTEDSFICRSCGPDAECYTKDDVTASFDNLKRLSDAFEEFSLLLLPMPHRIMDRLLASVGHFKLLPLLQTG